jgi:hypothetical protein
MSAEKLYSEIFEDFQKAQTKEERIQVLRKNDHIRFREFLLMAFSKKIVFDIDEIPEYTPAKEPAGLNLTYLDIEMPRMYRFIKGHPKRSPEQTQEKTIRMFLDILECLHKDEAELLVNAVKHNLDIPYLTTSLIEEAFPGFKQAL